MPIATACLTSSRLKAWKDFRLSANQRGGLERAQLVDRTPYLPDGIGEPANRLLVADLDNNGALDLIDTSYLGTHIWLGDAKGEFQSGATPSMARIFSITDLSGDGRLDLVGQTAAGEPVRLINSGSKIITGKSFASRREQRRRPRITRLPSAERWRFAQACFFKSS